MGPLWMFWHHSNFQQLILKHFQTLACFRPPALRATPTCAGNKCCCIARRAQYNILVQFIKTDLDTHFTKQPNTSGLQSETKISISHRQWKIRHLSFLNTYKTMKPNALLNSLPSATANAALGSECNGVFMKKNECQKEKSYCLTDIIQQRRK